MRIYLPGPGTLGCVVWPGAGSAHSQDIPLDFYTPHMNVEPPIPLPKIHSTAASASPAIAHLLTSTHPPPSRLYISTPPTHMDEYGFFKFLVVRLPYNLIYWQFWVLFVLRFNYNSFDNRSRRWSMSTYASILTRSPTHHLILLPPFSVSIGSYQDNRFFSIYYQFQTL